MDKVSITAIIAGAIVVLAMVTGSTVWGIAADQLTTDQRIACIESGGTTSAGQCIGGNK